MVIAPALIVVRCRDVRAPATSSVSPAPTARAALTTPRSEEPTFRPSPARRGEAHLGGRQAENRDVGRALGAHHLGFVPHRASVRASGTMTLLAPATRTRSRIGFLDEEAPADLAT